jgi:hypothetical protein
MHTPSEEQGTRAKRLQARAAAALHAMTPGALAALLGRIEEESLRRGLTYVREEDRIEAVRLFPLPVVVTPHQHAYVHVASMTLLSACKRLRALYAEDPDVRAALALPPEEEAWLADAHPSLRRADPVFARLDAVVDFARPDWKDTLTFVEPNLSGVGGLHLLPVAEQLMERVVVPHLASPELSLERGSDIRELMFGEIVDHLVAIGRAPAGAQSRTVALIEPRERTPGVEEQELLQRHFRARYGVEVVHADPRELSVDGGEVVCRGRIVDVAYRDYAVADLLELRRVEGADIEPMRRLFAENRMVSSITAEIDQKSDFEVLSDPALLERHFSADERAVIARHVPWTRLLRERRTLLPDGSTGELVAYARAHARSLVLKPNRSYGGYGVVVGAAVDAAAWQAAVEAAVAAPGAFVVQQRAEIPVMELPVRREDGGASFESCYVVMGFAATRDGLAILGRASARQVVNVAQRGGIVPVMLGHGGSSGSAGHGADG